MKNPATIALTLLALAAPSFAVQPAPMTLNQCLDRAFKQSPDLTRARSNLSIAGAGLQSSIGGMLPHLSATSTYSQSGPADPLLQNGRTDRYGTGLSLSQTLVNLPVLARIGQSAYTRKAAGAAFRVAEATLAYNVKLAYYNLVKLQKALDVAKAAVDQSEEQVKRARLMNQLGSMSRSDLLKVEVRLTQSKVDYLNATNALLAGQQSLATLLGMVGDLLVDNQLGIPDTAAPLAERDTLLAAALSASPSYQMARNSYRSSALGAWSSWTAKLPSLSASYSYGFSNNRQYQDAADWNRHDSWSAGLSLSWNIFDGLITEASIRQSYAQKRSAAADLFTAEQSVASEVEQAYLGLKTSREQLSLVRDLQQQAEEDYRLTNEKYKLGSASVLDLLTSQVSYNQAQQTATTAICDYYLAEARMKKAVGAW